MVDAESEVLRPLRFYVAPTDDGVVLKRGTTEIAISGAGAASVVAELVDNAKHGASRRELRATFDPEDWPAIDALLNVLTSSRLFVAAGDPEVGENAVDVWYWQFEQSRAAAAAALDAASIVVVGLNAIGQAVVGGIAAVGARVPRWLSDARLDDQRVAQAGAEVPMTHEAWLAEKPKPGTWVVATSSFGNLRTLLDYNRLCFESGLRFLPVLLQNSIGYLGPLVVPGETPCLDCAQGRWNSGLDPEAARQAVTEVPPEAQAIIGFHPAMASMLGDLAALELLKLIGQGLPFRRLGAQIEVQPLVPRITVRSILKLPRCPTCSPLQARPRLVVRRA